MYCGCASVVSLFWREPPGEDALLVSVNWRKSPGILGDVGTVVSVAEAVF